MSKEGQQKIDVDVEKIWNGFSVKQQAEFTENQNKFGKTREERIINFQKKIEFTKEFEEIFNKRDDELKAELLKRDKLGSVKELIDYITNKEDFFQNYEDYRKTWIDVMKGLSLEELKNTEVDIKKQDALRNAQQNIQNAQQVSAFIQQKNQDQVAVIKPDNQEHQPGQKNNLQNTDNQNLGAQNKQFQDPSQEEDLYSKIMNINLNRA